MAASDMYWASAWKAPDLTVGNYPADPNGTPPSDNRIHQVTCVGWRGQGMTMNLVTDGVATSSVTVTVWIFDPTLNRWLPWKSAIAVVYGTVQTLDVPGNARVYIQVTAVANAPTGLVAGYMTKD